VVGYRGSQPVHGEAPPEVLSYQIWYCQRYPGLKRRWSFWGEKEKRYFGWQVSFEVWMGIGWKGEVSPLDGRKRCRTLETGKKSKENIRNVSDCDGDQSLTSSTLWMSLSCWLIPSCGHDADDVLVLPIIWSHELLSDAPPSCDLIYTNHPV
jgi:hypothetical protein